MDVDDAMDVDAGVDIYRIPGCGRRMEVVHFFWTSSFDNNHGTPRQPRSDPAPVADASAELPHHLVSWP